MSSLKGKAYEFANEVALAFIDAGFTTVRRPGEPKGLRREERVRGDLLGLPLTVACRNQVTLDLPSAMREVKAEARAEGRDVYVSIQRRRNMSPTEPYDVGSSFVTTDLATFLRLLARLHPELVST